MSEAKIPPYEGEDGHLYFNYPLGAEYIFKPDSGGEFSYKILDCEYTDGTEYYLLESSGKELPNLYTANNLKFLMGWFPYEEVDDEAELVELPLLIEEVQLYFSDKRKEFNKLNVEYNTKLKETKYFKLVNAITSLQRPLELAAANRDTARVAELEKEKSGYEEERQKILNELGIDEAILRKIPACRKCYDDGIADGKICECAYEQTEAIKEYSAIKRLTDRARG